MASSVPNAAYGFVVTYLVLAIIDLIMFYKAFRLANTKSHFQRVWTVRFLFPFVCLVMCLESTINAIYPFLITPDDEDYSYQNEILEEFGFNNTNNETDVVEDGSSPLGRLLESIFSASNITDSDTNATLGTVHQDINIFENVSVTDDINSTIVNELYEEDDVQSEQNHNLATLNQALPDSIVIKVTLALITTQVPILLLTSFELCYLIHKRRSVNFCGIWFEQGQRVPTMIASFVLRNMFRFLSLTLMVMGLSVNFRLGFSVDEIDPEAGRIGWHSFITEGQNPTENLHLFLSLLPTAVLVLCSFYLSGVLWRYGTTSSMVVHSSMANQWFSMFFGTIALAVSQFFNSIWFPLASNIGLTIFVMSHLLIMYEVDRDMDAADKFAEFLKQVAIVGNGPMPSTATAPVVPTPRNKTTVVDTTDFEGGVIEIIPDGDYHDQPETIGGIQPSIDSMATLRTRPAVKVKELELSNMGSS